MHKALSIVLLAFSLFGCVTTNNTLTPLEIQSIQQREYQSTKSIVFSSVISVFQDLGYTVKNADINSGFITAESPMERNFDAATLLFGVSTANSTRATAFIEQIGLNIKVRLNFVASKETSSEYGNRRNEKALLNTQLYQNAFERIENAIFIRSAN